MESPIFIHSLFRAGSTYIFDVFRRSPAGYWCYQEPLHEAALAAKHNPNGLLNINSESMRLLRHPKLDKPYFYELFQVYEQWKDILTKDIIYETYFDQEGNERLIRYLEALIIAANGRPVIQECRTSNRISSIKRQLGGVHIYLWRNPWDQWWSYKTPGFSDSVTQLILNADNPPKVIHQLIQDIGFSRFYSQNIYEEIEYYDLQRLSPEDSYMVFYTLWCLGVIEGKKHADIFLNIDTLSDRPEYRQEVIRNLERFDIHEISFDNCRIAQSYYTQEEREFFQKIEDRVHRLLITGETPQEIIDYIVELRQEFQPNIWSLLSDEIPGELLIDSVRRAREYVLRIESRESFHVRQVSRMLTEALARAEHTIKRAEKAEAEKQAAVARAEHTIKRAEKAEAEKQAAVARAEHTMKRAERAEAGMEYLSAVLQEVYQSNSWKVTYPLRLLGGFARWFYHGSVAWLTLAPNSRPRRVTKKIFLSAKQEINTYPRLKSLLAEVLSRFPRLEERLRKVGQTAPPPVSLQVQPEINNEALEQLTPRARKIYQKLKTAIQDKKEGS